MYRDRKCERCGSIWLASAKDRIYRIFACKTCRVEPPAEAVGPIVHSRESLLINTPSLGEMSLFKRTLKVRTERWQR